MPRAAATSYCSDPTKVVDEGVFGALHTTATVLPLSPAPTTGDPATMPSALAADSNGVYWVEYGSGRIMAADPSPRTLITGEVLPTAIARDSTHWVYWGTQIGQLKRSSLNDANGQPDVLLQLDSAAYVSGIAVDPMHVYYTVGTFTDPKTGWLGRLSRYCSDTTSCAKDHVILARGEHWFSDLAIDPAASDGDAGQVYYLTVAEQPGGDDDRVLRRAIDAYLPAQVPAQVRP